MNAYHTNSFYVTQLTVKVALPLQSMKQNMLKV